ncbi:MAG TPA: 4-hydroxy-3-methylbut-2-enyl diphosphate reductase [Acholeplasma sp.]|nr:4-hydroxy-3-methylbut-2-enyl diphosphate reductase [Acholeplasma sp.]
MSTLTVTDLRPRGYCHGVVRALQIVKKIIKDESYPRPIYILGLIVHNKKITEAFNHYGVISLDNKDKTRLELLDDINTGTVIFTAHGVSDQVIDKANSKKMTIVNATCRDVEKVHDAVKLHLEKEFEVAYIGHLNHPEPEGILGISKDITFLSNKIDALNYKMRDPNKQLFITNQTTLARQDINDVLDVLYVKYPNLIFDDDICDATTKRQQAVIDQPDVDLLIVVGDSLSSNSNKLAFVSNHNRGIKSVRIEGVEDIDINWFKDLKRISVTSGASTPTKVTTEVITFLKQLDLDNKLTWDNASKLDYLDILS